MKVWISHSHQDKDFVDRIKKYLIDSEHEVVSMEHDLVPGATIYNKISESIGQADAFILVFSKSFSKSSWLTTEIAIIMSELSQKTSKIFIPIIIDRNVEIPSFIKQFVFLDFTNNKNFKDNVIQLIKALSTKSDNRKKIQVEKSLNDSIRIQERLLKEKMLEYKLEKQKRTNLKMFSVFTVISALLSSIVLIIYFSKHESIFEDFNETFSVVSFVIGIVSTLLLVFIFSFFRKGGKTK